ncbi:MAG: hypothetical protein HY905_25950 [Deltaproteobacteria bacterium]|nr:hypothetical protein [Deltaproteobacteria bacterium]
MQGRVGGSGERRCTKRGRSASLAVRASRVAVLVWVAACGSRQPSGPANGEPLAVGPVPEATPDASASRGAEAEDAGTPGAELPAPSPRGEPIGDPVSVSIGATGGEIASEDGRFTVSFPEGALSGDTEIVLTPVRGTAETGVGTAYSMEPDGVTFAKPVTVAFHLTDADLARTSIGGLDVATQADDGYWEPVGEVTSDEAARTLTAQVAHFSPLCAIGGYVLDPFEQEVNVGMSLEMRINACTKSMGAYGSGDQRRRIWDCHSLYTDGFSDDGRRLGDVSVNGITSGDRTVGETRGVREDWPDFVYVAPERIPANPRVVVSATVHDPNARHPTVTVMANLTIVDNRDLTGWFSMEYTPSATSMAYASGQTFLLRAEHLSLAWKDESGMEANYLMTGNVTISPSRFTLGSDEVVCTLDAPTQPMIETNVKVVNRTPHVLRWNWSSEWHFTCMAGGYPFPCDVVIGFGTGSGPGCLEPTDLPLDDSNWQDGHIAGVGHSDCNQFGRTNVEFSFWRPDSPGGYL